MRAQVRVVAWLCAAGLLLGGCGLGSSASEGDGGGPPADPPEGQALVSLVAQHGASHHNGHSLTTDMLALQTLDWLEAEADFVIEDAELAQADDGLVVEAMVVNFLSRARQRADPNMNAWHDSPEFCIAQWPPERPLGAVAGPAPHEDWRGRLYPVEGLRIKAGDVFAVSVVARGPGAGEWAGEGLRLRYRHSGRWYQQATNTQSFSLHVEDEAADFDGGVCSPRPNRYVEPPDEPTEAQGG